MSIIIVLLSLFLVFIGIAIAASSHKIAEETRYNAVLVAKMVILLGPLCIIAVWLPWKNIVRKFRNKM